MSTETYIILYIGNEIVESGSNEFFLFSTNEHLVLFYYIYRIYILYIAPRVNVFSVRKILCRQNDQVSDNPLKWDIHFQSPEVKTHRCIIYMYICFRRHKINES